ncbi:MAG: response regulator, partial [Roseiflexaceae bacterium]
MAVILAIDEDVVLTMSLDLQLGHVGHTVRRANTITVALSHYSETPPTVVVIDPSLEQQNGWQLVSKWVATVPVIIISHDPTDATRQRAETLGCAAVLAKPFLMRDLVNLITPFLDEVTTSKKPTRKRATAPQPIVDGESKTPRAPRKRTQRTDQQPVVSSEPQQRQDTLGIGMSDADEQLLAGLPTTAAHTTTPEPKGETLGMRMRKERLKRNIPLAQIDL